MGKPQNCQWCKSTPEDYICECPEFPKKEQFASVDEEACKECDHFWDVVDDVYDHFTPDTEAEARGER